MNHKTSTSFHKYRALGNDMAAIDPAHFPHDLTPDLIRHLCHRHLGIGADGICYGPLPDANQPLTMRFFNPDGSEAEKSGNGLRIFARYLWDAGYVQTPTFTIQINNEPIAVTIENDAATLITTSLGRLSFALPFTPESLHEITDPHLTPDEYQTPATAVNIGNPHFVLFVESLSAERVQQVGPLLETATPFPNRTNVQLVHVLDPHTIQIEIWERGAGYTLASGTSASASAGAAIWNGRCQSPVKVIMPGGTAVVAIDNSWQVQLTGAVEAVFTGILESDFLGYY